MRKQKIISLIALTTLLVTNSLSAQAANGVDSNSEGIVTFLKTKSVETNYNIMLYDEEGRILNEFHTDGEIISFSYQDDELCEVLNTNGNKDEISVQNGTFTVTRFRGEQQIDVMDMTENKERCITVDKEARNALLEAAANGLIIDSKIPENFSITADTITSGYNLSTMCPSVWTVSMGYDRFARPSTALDKEEIQDFLESKNSVLADDILIYRVNSNGTVYNTGVTINPATAIYNASKTHKINPKIILGSLQREQGLITKTSGNVSTRAFYFCMGYGATDSGDINGYTGFDIQIDKGTDRYADLWYEAYQLGESGLPISFAASDGTLSVNNCGTYALYRYTPWQSSNLLFLQILKGYWPDSNGVNGINWE